jgi:WhiB family transcriptional regulator, redox-sensing transcriptional regulator
MGDAAGSGTAAGRSGEQTKREKVNALSTMEALTARYLSAEGGWEERAACRGADVELFFSVEEADQKEGLEFCARCTVRSECLESAIANREMYGIWGGMLETDRRSLIRDLRRRERESRPPRQSSPASRPPPTAQETNHP